MTSSDQRTKLSRERVLERAVELADEIGIEPFTIRKLATALSTSPMTLYYHVKGKEQIIDGMVDMVFDEIAMPPSDIDWKSAMRIRCLSARQVLKQHPWAPPLMESRTSPGPASLRHHEAMLACLRRGGLPLPLAAHAYAIIDSFVYGFALQEANLPFEGNEEIGELAQEIVAAFPNPESYPYLVEFTTGHVLQPGYSFGSSFKFGLDLILDGIEAATHKS